MLIYLGFSALAVFVATFALQILGEASILVTTHLIFAVAILPLIFGAIAHFVPVLTRSSGAPQAVMLAPVLLQITGLLIVLHFYGALGTAALHAAAGIALLDSLAFIGWLIYRARNTLGKPHPGWRWYLAATVCLALGLTLVPAMFIWPAWRQPLRLIHLHLNTLGFIGLTAIGTLQVLLPTVLSGPDAQATARLRSDLPWAVGGVLATSLGAAFWWPLALIGAGLMAFVGARLGLAWLHRYGVRTLLGDGASAALSGALCGFLLLVAFGIAHSFGYLNGRDAVPAFIAAFLLPLVTGALSQLLPVWRYPGRLTPLRTQMRRYLVAGGAGRTLPFLCGGALLAFGHGEGLWLTAIGLLHFLLGLIRAFNLPKVSAPEPL